MTRIAFFRSLYWLLALLAFSALASAEWKEKVLYSFQGGSTDGSLPAGGVVFDKAGNLYGVNSWGGPGGCPSPGCGTVFEISPPAQKGGAWTESTIYGFQGVQGGAKDGLTPAGGLIIDQHGNLYGTTSLGGSGPCVLLGSKAGCGIIFQLSPPQRQGGSWAEAILYSFQGGNDGYFPAGSLVFDKKGALYGATQFGGGKGTSCDIIYGGQCGTVFKLSPPKQKGGAWTEKVLHAFSGDGGDGASPNGGLIVDSKDAIYGTTYAGGNQACPSDGSIGCGTIFRLTAPDKNSGSWAEKQIHIFSGGDDGGGPNGNLAFGSKGAIYGTAGGGGAGQNGVVFRIARSPAGHWVETELYSFVGGSDGSGPSGGLIFDESGKLYGTALGGTTHLGVVFRLTSQPHGSSWKLTTLYNFVGSPDGNHPLAGVVSDELGRLYGTTVSGGNGSSCQGGCGAVFEVSH